MKTIIAGSRHLSDSLAIVEEAVAASGIDITEVVSGKEPNGIDKSGELWADKYGKPVKAFPADWSKFGNSAGPRRNGQMAAYAEALIAIPHPRLKSKGTYDMIEQALTHGLKIYIHRTGASYDRL